ncbi:hypothetical protein BU16DRAFT_65653 [Lophium mytilinum]|uniref:Uncharacterized protein n=1 Tax=Lophium mytilinum TaxID=390894 RepID=A0A6A6QNQ4_9PEZI|nr:hypothetical protein BU16DRAFT_65653 [Lophium mytilinum]
MRTRKVICVVLSAAGSIRTRRGGLIPTEACPLARLKSSHNGLSHSCSKWWRGEETIGAFRVARLDKFSVCIARAPLRSTRPGCEGPISRLSFFNLGRRIRRCTTSSRHSLINLLHACFFYPLRTLLVPLTRCYMLYAPR